MASTTEAGRTRRSFRPLLLVAVAGLVAAAFAGGFVGHLSDEERLRSTVDSAGVWGPLLFLGLMALLVPLNVPGVLFVVPATTLFGTAGGIVLSLAGGYVASVIGVAAARSLGRSALESRLSPRIRRLEARLSAGGFRAVVVLRMFTYLSQPVDWMCGLSSIPMRTVLTGTLAGLVPPTVVIALGGDGLLGFL